MRYAFDEATAIAETGPGHYSARLHEGWGVWDTVNGGYVAAVAAQAMIHSAGKPHPMSLTAHFIRPAKAGPVTIITDVVAAGKRLARVKADVSQGDRTVISLMGAFGDLSEAQLDLIVDGDPPTLPALVDCTSPDRTGIENASVAQRVAALTSARDSGWIKGSPSGEMTMAAWLRFSDDRPVDPLGLIFLADSMPPPIFNSGLGIRWVPTIEMTTHVRRIPAPGWLRFKSQSRFATAGTVEEDVELWDEEGHLVAQARQLALLRSE